MFNIFRELSVSLNLPDKALFGFYQTGIKRDPINKQVWRRLSDGVQVELDGWYPGYPKNNDGWDYLYLYQYYESYKTDFFNDIPKSGRFICEYF